jgi:periplasmic protein TonB
MKAVNKLAIVLSLGVLAPFAASAKTLEEAYVENYQKKTDVPVPVAVVSPSVSAEYAGSTVELAFIVDATGKPTELSVTSSPAGALSEAIVDAVKQWRFTPAHVNGAPVATKVVLPVKIVDEAPAGAPRFASN